MRKDLVYLLLPLALAACTESDGGAMDDTPEGKYAGYRVTGSINPIQVTSRVVDGEVETKFQENDVMLIGWNASGSETYNGYAYTYNDEKFSPTDGNPASLWTALEKETGTVDVYAWYRKNGEQTVIPVGNTLSVTTDQSTEAQYTSNIYLAAHTICSSSTTSLEFGFSHLMARLKFSIDFNDKGISTSEVQRAVVKTRLYISGTLQPGTGTYKNLELISPNTLEKVTMLTQGNNNYHIDCTCLLPPQTLTTTEHSISIILDNGKEYICTLSKNLTLRAGEEAKVPIEISVVGTSVYDPVVTVIPETKVSSYSGNRLFTANSDNTLSIYDKQADGSWGAPAKVYKDLHKDELVVINSVQVLDIYKDNAAFGTTGNAGKKLYFCKRDKDTGKWYQTAGPLDRETYAVVLNEHFVAAGGGGSDQNESTTIYSIDENGINSNGTKYTNIQGSKLSIGDNDVICTNFAAYKLFLDGTTPKSTKIVAYNSNGTARVFSDGYKAIMQINATRIKIYNISTGVYEIIQDPPYAGVGRPVAIYDKYVLVGGSAGDKFSDTQKNVDWLLLLYYDGTEWIHIGNKDDPDSFLKLLRTYAPNDEMMGDDFHLEGTSIIMKGTRAVIQSHGKSYFIENIDELVSKWLKDNPLSTNT